MFTHASVPLLTGAVILTATFAAHSAVAYVRRGRRGPVTSSASVFTGAGLATVAGVVAVTLDEPSVTGLMLAGRPAVWLALQGAALVTAIAAGMTAHAYVHGWSHGVDRLDFGLLTFAGGVFLPWAMYAGLLLP